MKQYQRPDDSGNVYKLGNTMKFNFIKAALLGFALTVSGFASASIITVDFIVINAGTGDEFQGQFSGSDIDSNNIISFDELQSFSFATFVSDLSQLFDMGDFQIEPSFWFNNGISWEGSTDTAYFTWGNRAFSANDQTVLSIEYSVRNVPEPSTLAILALGLIGLGARRFKK